MKNHGKTVLCVISALLILLYVPFSAFAAAPLTVETQFSYSVSSPAWLKDLGVYENMTDLTAITKASNLHALPDYPYTKTPDTFKSDVDYHTNLYTLDETGRRAAYIFILDYLNQSSAAVSDEVTDREVREYLEANGVIYPYTGADDPETLILARSLYSVMSSGALGVTVEPGTSLEGALVQYLTIIFGDDMAELLLYTDKPSLGTLEDYLLAVCKVDLHMNSYTVSADTPAEEVYRLTAIQTIKTAGINVDEQSITTDELKVKYTAATLGLHYDVDINSDELEKALANGEVALYIIRLLGKQNGLAIKDDMSYTDAFNLVAEHTDVFAIELGEFYADIYNYSVQLDYQRERIWVCPTALRTPGEGETLEITVNGQPAQTGAYAEVALNPQTEIQGITITVTFSDAEQTVTKNYNIKVYQGTAPAPKNEGTLNGNSAIGLITGNTLGYVSSIFGLNGGTITPGTISDLPGNAGVISALIVPSIGLAGTLAGTLTADNTVPAGQSFYSSTLTLANTQATANASAIGTLSALNLDLIDIKTKGVLYVQAAPPPLGYSYVVDEHGYVVGIVRQDEAAEESTTEVEYTQAYDTDKTEGISFGMFKGVLPAVLIPGSIAIITIIFTIALRKKK